jgi:hypothetical protein
MAVQGKGIQAGRAGDIPSLGIHAEGFALCRRRCGSYVRLPTALGPWLALAVMALPSGEQPSSSPLDDDGRHDREVDQQ